MTGLVRGNNSTPSGGWKARHAELKAERDAAADSNGDAAGGGVYSDMAEMVLVPRDPTEAMLGAAWTNTERATADERMACELAHPREAFKLKMRRRYRAMVAAAGEAN